MPRLLTMKSFGVSSKIGSSSLQVLTRGKEERGLGSLLTQVRMSPSKKGRRQTDLQAVGCVTRANLTKNRMLLLGDVGDLESTFDMFDDKRARNEKQLEPSSVCLAAMVDEFLEEGVDQKSVYGRSRYHGSSWSSSGDEGIESTLVRELSETLHRDNIRERILHEEVTKAVVAAKDGEGASSLSTDQVMRHLRQAGYKAGICKCRWDHSGEHPGGEYEYVDVDFEGSTAVKNSERIIVDIDFKAQFEIARPTAEYDTLVRILPTIFVGRVNRLLWIVNFMTGAVKSSLKERGMHLPPWRKPEYMISKWFSTYERTIGDTLPNFVRGTRVSNVNSPPRKGTNRTANLQKSAEFSQRGNLKQLMPGNVTGIVVNGDWQPPVLKARRSQGPGHAGLASLFKAANLPAPMDNVNRDQVLRSKCPVVVVSS